MRRLTHHWNVTSRREFFTRAGSGLADMALASMLAWCRASDQPIAGLLTDLAQRGMLNDSLVVWGGEFGRTPFNERGDGRDHNP